MTTIFIDYKQHKLQIFQHKLQRDSLAPPFAEVNKIMIILNIFTYF